MKKYMISILLALPSILFSQQNVDTLGVSFDNTLYLLFDSPVIKVDIGNAEEVIESHEEGDTKVGLKAKEEFFKFPTSVLIETKTAYFAFVLVYDSKSKLFLPCPNSRAVSVKTLNGYEKEELKAESEVMAEKEMIDYDTLQKYIQRVNELDGNFQDYGITKGKMSYFLDGLYYQDNYIFAKVIVSNKSSIPYDISYMSFVIKDKKGAAKKSSVQDEVMKSVYETQKGRVNGKSQKSVVLVFDKFTLSNNKRLYLDLWEKGGDRYLIFPVSGKAFNAMKTIKLYK